MPPTSCSLTNGHAKIAFVENCRKDGTQHALPLGVITIEMMENGLSPREGENLALRDEKP